VSASCLDFLLIELVPMAYRLTNELELAARQQETETVMDEEDERGAVFWRLERIGYRVGQGLVERYVKPPFLTSAGGHGVVEAGQQLRLRQDW
jgi:hypothetical protein